MAVIRGVVLDVGGTLVDSNEAHAKAWAEAFAKNGFPNVSPGDVRTLFGKGTSHLLQEIAGVAPDSETGQAIVAERVARFKSEYLPTIQPFPGARDLLLRLKQDGIRLAVASSPEEREETDALLDRVGAEPNLIDAVVSPDEVKAEKPEPDIILAALNRIGGLPEEAIVLGDTPFDVEAAVRAQAGSISLRCGGWSDHELQARGALEIYDDPADLLARYDESILGQARGYGR